LASLQPKESPWFTLSAALRVLYLQGYTIAWRNVYEGTDAAFIDGLPCYPFENTNFIVPYIEHSTVGLPKLLNASEGQPSGLGFEFLNQIIQRGDFTAEFQADMATITPFIKAHVVGEIPLCPASVYIELALEAVESQGKSPHPGFRTLTDIGFKNPLISTDATTPVLNITLQADETRPHDRNAFTTSSLEHGAHCTGIITMSPAPLIENLAARKTAYVRRQKLAVFAQDSHPLETFSAKTIYQIIFPRVVSYSPPLETLKHLQMSPAGLEGYGVFKLPPLHRGQQMVCHPALVDTLLHVAGFIANATTDAGTAYICSSIDYVVVPTKTSHLHAQQLEAYCSLVDVGHSVIGDAYALDARGEVVAWVEGMTFKKLSLRSFKSQLSRLAASPKRLLEKNTIPQSHTKGINRPQSGVKPLGRPLKTNTDAREDRVSKLHSIIREVCGLDSAVPLSSETMLSSLGIDSLLQTELGEILGQRLPLSENSEIDIETCQTIQDLEKVIETTTTSTVSWPSTPSEEFEAPGLPGLGFAASSDTETPITTSPQATPSGGLEDVFRSVFGLDISGISKNTITLGSLGVDSLGSVELIEELEERFGLESLNGQDSISDLTIQGLESLVQAAIAGAAVSKGLNSEDLATLTQVDVSSRHSERRQPTPEAPRIPTRDFPTPLGKHNPGNISLYLFHDGSGKCGMYSRLDVPGYNIFGVYSLDFELLDPGIRTMEDLAALYIEKAGLDSRDDSGEIALGGESFPREGLDPNFPATLQMPAEH
jgi:acyl carrier protein